MSYTTQQTWYSIIKSGREKLSLRKYRDFFCIFGTFMSLFVPFYRDFFVFLVLLCPFLSCTFWVILGWVGQKGTWDPPIIIYTNIFNVRGFVSSFVVPVSDVPRFYTGCIAEMLGELQINRKWNFNSPLSPQCGQTNSRHLTPLQGVIIQKEQERY